MKFFAICNGIPVHISDTQKGKCTLVLLHGYLETLYIWEEFTSLMEKEMRIISFDLPGHGLSGSHMEVNSLEFYAATVVEVMKKCNVEKAAIMGHSMGGFIAVEAVKRYQEKFSSLILMHSGPNADSEQKRMNREREIALVKESKLGTIIRRSIPQMYAPENLKKCENKINETIELAETHEPQGIIATLRGLISRPDNTSILEKCRLPVLLFFGKFDNYIPMEKAEQLSSLLPDATSYTLEHSGHNGFIEEQGLVIKYLSEFLNLNGNN